MSTNDWSLPETEVFDRIRTALDDESAAALATVVAVDGSAYRRPGAKMLVRPDGGGAGSLAAGCLESEVRSLAADVLADGSPRVRTWDLTDEDDAWGLGVGCNGVITVLVEPADDSYRPVVDARDAGASIGVATVVGGDAGAEVGTRAYFRPGDGFSVPEGRFPRAAGISESVLAELEAPMTTLVEDGEAETVSVETDGGRVEVFLEGVRPPAELVVFGSGPDVPPVVELATLVGFRVTVVSFRGARADEGRFPRAEAVVASSPHDVGDVREWDESTYAVVMSHNFLDDRLAVRALLETPVPYIGLMGPRKRFEEMREAFADDGRTLTEAERDRIYTPVGLSLGGDSPYQIAYSIVAELLAVAHDRTPRHLDRREGPIHDRVDLTASED